MLHLSKHHFQELVFSVIQQPDGNDSTLRFFNPLASFPHQRLANSKAHTSRFISANLPCNKFKNRLVNIMPYETTRVCLQPIRGVEGSDYINASFIDGYRYAWRNCFFSEGSVLKSTPLSSHIWEVVWGPPAQLEKWAPASQGDLAPILFLTLYILTLVGNRKHTLPPKDHWQRPQKTSGACSGRTTQLL